MGCVQRPRPRMRYPGMTLQPGHQATQKKIVQYHGAGYFFLQEQHVPVKRRVADLVEYPVDLIEVRLEPGYVPNLEMTIRPGIGDLVLCDHDCNVIILRQCRK